MDHDMLKQEVSHGETATNYHVERDNHTVEEEPKLHLKTFLVLVVRTIAPGSHARANHLAGGCYAELFSTVQVSHVGLYGQQDVDSAFLLHPA